MPTDTNKVFGFAIEINGIDQALIQNVKKPEKEVGAVEHGVDNRTVKTAGGVTVSDAELQTVKDARTTNSEFWTWLSTAVDGNLAENYKRDIVFKEKNPANQTMSIEIWKGAWVRKSSSSNYVRGNQNENVIDTITISVDDVVKVK